MMTISKVKQNILVNILGKCWSALMGLVCIPLYVKFMGIEAYGLVGFFATLQAVLTLFDMGLSTTLNRELACYSARPKQAQDMRDLVRTLEIVYWGGAILIGLAVLCLSGPIARDWIRVGTLSTSTVQQAVKLMGLVMIFQLPLGFYSGGLLGLQRQVLHSGLNAGWYTLRFAGAVLVLWLFSPTVLTFFTWQVFVSILSTFCMILALWRSLPTSHQPPRFQKRLLLSVGRFIAGISGISITVLLLTQLDKIILSRLLSLEFFGYYMLASTVAYSILLLINPVFMALFPSFSQRVALGDTEGLRYLYHRACQLASVMILPVAVMLVLFAPEVMLVWSGDPVMAQNTHLVVTFLAIGYGLSGLMYLPYALQLAYGWTKLTLYTNIVALSVLTPLIFLMTTFWGAIGAAIVQVILSSGYILIQIPIMHRRLLAGEQWYWYWEDVGIPLAVALTVGGLGRSLLVPLESMSRMTALIWLISVSTMTFIAVAWSTPLTRDWFKDTLFINTFAKMSMRQGEIKLKPNPP